MESNPQSPVFSQSLEAAEAPAPPVRPSGFLALILGLLSFTVLLFQPMILLPILAVLCGLFAMRPSRFGPPVGRRAAMLGILLAVFFASWGTVSAQLRNRELSKTGARFGADWLELTSMGEWESVLELTKTPKTRQNPKMPLKEYYSNSEARASEMETFKEQSEISDLIDAADKPNWELAEPPLVYTRHGGRLVQTRFVDTTDTISYVMRVELERSWDPINKVAQWKVTEFGKYTPKKNEPDGS